MSAYLNALREEGSREDLMREVERQYDENLRLRKALSRIASIQISARLRHPMDELVTVIQQAKAALGDQQ